VVEAVRKQEEALKQLARKRRRHAPMMGETPYSFDGFEPDDVEALEAVLAAERAETTRSTRSRSSTSLSQGSLAAEESPPDATLAQHAKRLSDRGKQPASRASPRVAQTVARSPTVAALPSPMSDPKCDGVPDTPGSDKPGGCASPAASVAASSASRRGSDEADTNAPFLGYPWLSLDSDCSSAARLAARRSFWSPENVTCVAVHPSGADVAVAVASARRVAVHCCGNGGSDGGKREWTDCTIVDHDDKVEVLAVCFVSGGNRLVVGGRFVEPGVLCRVFEPPSGSGGATASVVTKYPRELRIEAGGSLHCMAACDHGSTLFTCGWSEDGMAVTVAVWDLLVSAEAIEPRAILPTYVYQRRPCL